MKMAKRRKIRRVARRVARRAGVALVRAGRRARANAGAVKHELVTPAVSAVAAAGVGYAEAQGKALPTVAGIMPELVYGVVGAVLGTMVGATSRGTVGKVVRGAATGVLSVGAYKLGRGDAIRVGEDDGPAPGYVEE